MPKVGSKHFSYTPAGRAAAKAVSKRTGQPVTRATKPAERVYKPPVMDSRARRPKGK